MLSPEEITAIAYRALDDKKAKDVKILKTGAHRAGGLLCNL